MVKQARAMRTRESLIRAAADVFATDGYAMASLPGISKRAGVSAGALHFHFASKEELAERVERAAEDAVAELVERCRVSSGGPLQALAEVTGGLLRVAAVDSVVRAGFRLSADPSRKNAQGLPHRLHTGLRGLVLEARDAGQIAGEVPVDAVTTAIVAATVGFEVLGAGDHTLPPAERLAQWWTFLLPRLTGAPDGAPRAAAPSVPCEP